MIIKSMSRKTPSFDQLIQYMDSEKSDRDYDLHFNCYSRNQEHLIAEFYRNSLNLSQRKGGNYLYHEIISISRKGKLSAKQEKEALREIVIEYVGQRCPQNMVYGCLHEDHDHHLHYHLLISANEYGESKRHFLKKKEFEQVKRDVENWALEHHGELQQEQIIDHNSQDIKMKKAVNEGIPISSLSAIPTQESVRGVIEDTLSQSHSREDFERFLAYQGYEFYTRGKNFGVIVKSGEQSKKYRFSTLKVHEDYVAFLEKVEGISEGQEKQEAEATQKSKRKGRKETGFVEDIEQEKDHQDDHKQDVHAPDISSMEEGRDEPQIFREDIKAQQTEQDLSARQNIDAEENKSFACEKEKDTLNDSPPMEAENNQGQKPLRAKFVDRLKQKIKPSSKPLGDGKKEEEAMKLKDVFGLKESYQERDKARAVKPEEVENIVARESGRVADQLENNLKQSEEANRARTVEEVKQELQKMNEQKQQSAKHRSKHSL